jgi:hypothetical protein
MPRSAVGGLVALALGLAAWAAPAAHASQKSAGPATAPALPQDLQFWFQPFRTSPWHQQTVAKG